MALIQQGAPSEAMKMASECILGRRKILLQYSASDSTLVEHEEDSEVQSVWEILD